MKNGGNFFGQIIKFLTPYPCPNDIVVAIRDVPATIGRTNAVNVVAPRIATKQFIRDKIFATRICFRTIAIIISIIPVLTPLPNITTHVIYSKFVWLFCAYFMCFIFAITTVQYNIFYNIATAIFISFAFISAPCCIFPFCFGWQSATRSFAIIICSLP